ncbi:hypothetical protein MPTK2_8g15055 [Marchantia polymorpha subsp. ruderalis]
MGGAASVHAREPPHSLGFVFLRTRRGGVQGRDGSTASELGSPGNRRLTNIVGKGRKGGADSTGPAAKQGAGCLHVRVPRSQLNIRRCKSWPTLLMRLSSSRKNSTA